MRDVEPPFGSPGEFTIARVRRERGQILATARRYGVHNVRVFGSLARGEADDHSDLDLLVDAAAGRSLLDLSGFALEVEDLLGRPVDVTTSAGLKSRLRDRILAEAVPL